MGGLPFMVALPTVGLGGVLPKPATNADCSAASQALFAELRFQDVRGGLRGAARGIAQLLPGHSGLYWTEHSARNGLQSFVEAMLS